MSDENNKGDVMKDNEPIQVKKEVKSTSKLKQIGLPIIGVFTALFLLSGGVYGYLYVSTPSHLRFPQYEHYHLRTQIVVNGESVDFSRDEFQEDYDKNSCSADLTGQPIDFHDNMDQMAHVHWRGVTGGEFLKFYGWNLIGGEDDSLGRRYDQGMMNMHHVRTAGNLLPEIPKGANFYVYIGDENSYEQKEWNEFLISDLEDFLGKKSLLNNEDETSFSPLDWFTQKAYAHGMEDDGHSETSELENDEEKLERINNLIGNIVIFVQDTQPTEQQAQERFANLVPLSDSVCGG
ncbi:MAG: hypothetical protein WD432_03380 [Candidatus Saccharimonadales bacterium]